MEGHLIFLSLCFFLIALVYSSVGFGGGSSYLALLAIMQVDYMITKPTALFCNIIVVTGGTFIFYKEGKLDFRKSLPFVAASIPLAFVGGYWRMDEGTFFVILGSCLLAASVFLWIQPPKNGVVRANNTLLNIMFGGGIGFLSGLVGIGGGIFLAPILHLRRWDEAKKISALASLFILVNSVSGLAGQLSQDVSLNWRFIIPLLVAVFVGGQIGSRIGARKFNVVYVKRITALVIFAAAVNILKEHLP